MGELSLIAKALFHSGNRLIEIDQPLELLGFYQ